MAASNLAARIHFRCNTVALVSFAPSIAGYSHGSRCWMRLKRRNDIDVRELSPLHEADLVAARPSSRPWSFRQAPDIEPDIINNLLVLRQCRSTTHRNSDFKNGDDGVAILPALGTSRPRRKPNDFVFHDASARSVCAPHDDLHNARNSRSGPLC